MSEVNQTIERGGISLTAEENTSAVLAKRYTNPALGERVVVRLVQDGLAEVEDLSLEIHGFAPDGQVPVGFARTRAVGFPAWPIIHDPGNARHALNLVGDLQRAAKAAKRSAGEAQRQLDDLAKKLDASAPHFLPTFLEEAARIFIANENYKFGAQFFSKAREAERVHGLKIDEARHQEALLEFALAGALSAKELTNESKALLTRTTPEAALELFNRLIVDRVKGGLPPYTAQAADGKRLAKAAGVAPLEVEKDFLRETLASPALGKAAAGFWKGYLTALKELALENDEYRQAVIAFAPTTVDPDAWVDLLEDIGAADDLRHGRIDAAAWTQNYIQALQRSWNLGYPVKLIALIRQIPSLAGKTITLSSWTWRAEPEIVDAVLSAGGLIAFENTRNKQLTLNRWLGSARNDLPHLCANPEMAELVAENFNRLNPADMLSLVERPALYELAKKWAVTRLGDSPSLSELGSERNRLSGILNPAGVQAYRQSLEPFFAKLDGPKLLAAGLNLGFLTELTWPALERAEADLKQAHGACCAEHIEGRPRVYAAWPAMGIAYDSDVRFVDGDEVVAQQEFKIAGADNPFDWSFTLIDGVIGVMFRKGWDRWIGWSNEPGREVKVGYAYPRTNHGGSYPIPGGRLCNFSVQRVGSDKPDWLERSNVLTDGKSFWQSDYAECYAMDANTGKKGRASLPPELADRVEASLREGYRIAQDMTTWRPAAETTRASLLSTADGWHKFVMLRRDEAIRVIDADGTVYDYGSRHEVRGRLRRPGGGHWLVGSGSLRTEGNEWAVPDASDWLGRSHLLHRVPACGWHQYRVRDEAASARLRQATAEQCQALYEAAPLANQVSMNDNDEAADIITDASRVAAQELLGTADPALVDSTIWLAARIKLLIKELEEARSGPAETGGTFTQWPVEHDGFNWFKAGYRDADRDEILAVGQAMKGEKAKVSLPGIRVGLVAAAPEAVLACVAAPLQPTEHVQTAAAFFGAVLDADLLGPEAIWFKALTNEDLDNVTVFETPEGRVLQLGKLGWYDKTNPSHFVGRIGELPVSFQGAPTELVLKSRGIPADELKSAFNKLLAAGPPAWDPAWVSELAAGTGWSEAAAGVFLTGMQGVGGWATNYLPTQVRALLGIKVAQATSAKEFLQAIDDTILIKMYAAAANDPIRLVTAGPDIPAMVEVWQELGTQRFTLPEALLSALTSQVGRGAVNAVDALATGKALSSRASVSDGLAALLWLAANLEPADPLRQWVADGFGALVSSIENANWEWTYQEPKVRAAFGLPAATGKARPTQQVGAWTVTQAHENWDTVKWEPKLVTDWQSEVQLLRVLDEHLPDALWAFAALKDGTFNQLIEDLQQPSVGTQQDPLVSAPEVVAEAMVKLGLTEASARYWLQLLALPNPTDKNVDAWNGWKKADRTKAAAPLLEAGHAVEAKRARAGRSYFLPGGWLEASAPHLPLEVWKAPMFELRDAQKVGPVFGVVAPLVPYDQLYADAWDRYLSGDVPGYVELRTQRSRRR